MKKLTLTLEEELVAWALVYAAQRGKSVTRLLGELLQERMHEIKNHDEAMHRYLSRKPLRFEWVGGRPAREDLHDRVGLRRDENFR